MKKWAFLVFAAAFLLLLFTLQGGTGSAVINKIKTLFEPEKKVVQEIEGQKENTDLHLNVGIDAEYVIYIDESRYKLTRDEEADIITTVEPLPDHYPEVSMEIRQVADVPPDELVTTVAEELQKGFPALGEPEFVSEPVEGFQLHGINGGQEWDSPIVHAYVISNGKTGSFVITERYFLEAAEGHGARFYEMLKEFKILTED